MPDANRPPDSDNGDSSDARVTHWKGFQLSAFQIQAVEAIRDGKSVLVGAPTGAGKTLVAEYAIEDAVRRGRRCVYTSPIKALSNQKYRDFRDDPSIDVGLMTGDVTIHPNAQVLIMTTEILRNAIFEDPDRLHDIEYVVFDEVHYMDDLERGTVWEESLIFAPKTMRFICLSATVPNIEQLGAWIRSIRDHELTVIQSAKRPVPLRHRLYAPDVGSEPFDIGRLGHFKKRARELTDKKKRKKSRGRRGRPPRPGPPDERKLLDAIQEDQLLPALVFCFSRRDCERLAFRNQDRKLLDRDEYDRMQALQRELIDLFKLDAGELKGEVFQIASHGIAYHHAGMLPIHKEVVERMFTSGLLKLLFTTETFALGINMPARVVIFNSLKKFDGVSFDYLRTREYHQMAGRAGRQGIDETGLVVSLLGLRDLEDAPMQRLIDGGVEPVESRFQLSYATILHLVHHLGREGLQEAWEKSFNNFQHRARSQKARERNRRQQRALVEAHVGFLEELGYLEDDDQLTAKGRVASVLYGYELQITEMLFNGALENLAPDALAMVFVSLVHEERRRGGEGYVSPKMYGGVRRHITQILFRLSSQEARFRIPQGMKVPDWGLTPAVLAWMEGSTFEELEQRVEIPGGDMCRTFRMALQLMRQVRRVIDSEWDLADRLGDACVRMNRDEVDARRQLELG